MGAVGIGLGFILNNLNVFGQEIAGRERFGITTALLQSTRMVGGMLGTSIVATVVQHHYRNVVTRTMSVLGEPAASQWRPRFVDLRILIDEASRLKLIADMKPSGLDTFAYRQPEWARALEKQGVRVSFLSHYKRLMPLARLLGPTYGVPGLKAALNLLGYDVGVPRQPLAPVPESALPALRDSPSGDLPIGASALVV